VDDLHLSVVTVVSHSYLGCSSSDIPANDKDGVSNGEEVEDPSLKFSDAIEEDFLRIVKFACPKNKGRREVLNLNSFINYGDASVSSRRGEGKAHVL
jgi:methionine-rich copper-binding protein CopC